jgi:CheY-like chemotaxis protein
VTVRPQDDAVPPLHVLVVDDDPLVLEGVAALLEDCGHTTLQAASGAAALDLLAGGATVDVVLTDYAMPRMNGAVLAGAIARLRPGLPVLLAGGDPDKPDAATGLARVAKPFRRNELVTALADLACKRGRVALEHSGAG